MRAPGRIGAAGHFHKLPIGESSDDAIDGHAANLFHLRARKRLAISDDRQRFQRRLGETRGAILHADQRAHPRRVGGLGDELPRAGHAHEAIAAAEAFDFADQNFQRGGDAFGFRAGVFLAIGFLAGLAQDVLQLLGAERFLRGK